MRIRDEDEGRLSGAAVAQLRELRQLLASAIDRWPDEVDHCAHVEERRTDPYDLKPDSMEIDLKGLEQVAKLIRGIRGDIREISDKLDVDKERSLPPPGMNRGFLGELTVRLHRRDFLRGVVETRVCVPLAPALPGPVFLYLLSIPGLRDKLTRENHGHWGYHYHYMDAQERRSDTLLTFDHQSPPSSPSLLWERHAEGDKFKAKADKWGAWKKQSVYSVCEPDTKAWPLSAFKRPSAGALPVWP